MIPSDHVRRVMEAEGVSEKELFYMLSKATITRDLGYNRRYHHWLFKVSSDEVEYMSKDSFVTVGSGSAIAFETCQKCEGIGCPLCNWHGIIHRLVQ